jgi:homoaconitase/3-isopropylmalate dehydratase large subunit
VFAGASGESRHGRAHALRQALRQPRRPHRSGWTSLIYIDRHLVHEVTSPQAFEGLKLAGRKPWRAGSIVATADHNTPTQDWAAGIADPISRTQSRRSTPT